MLPRTKIIIAAVALAIAATGCELMVYGPDDYGTDTHGTPDSEHDPGDDNIGVPGTTREEPSDPGDPTDPTTPGGPDDGTDPDGRTIDPDLLTVTTPAGDTFEPGDLLVVEWTGSAQPDLVTIELYLAGSLHTVLASEIANAGSFAWTIPGEFPTDNEVFTEYQVVVSGRWPAQPSGELVLAAWSVDFAIVPRASGGLSEVTVDALEISVRLVDNGQQIDGDTVDLLLNGVPVVTGHVLAADPGTTFPLTLRPGQNVFEVYAVNEGSVSPNTALLEISNVTVGLTSQEWRLAAGEYGGLTITAPSDSL